jgi:hypothetical protein
MIISLRSTCEDADSVRGADLLSQPRVTQFALRYEF